MAADKGKTTVGICTVPKKECMYDLVQGTEQVQVHMSNSASQRQISRASAGVCCISADTPGRPMHRRRSPAADASIESSQLRCESQLRSWHVRAGSIAQLDGIKSLTASILALFLRAVSCSVSTSSNAGRVPSAAARPAASSPLSCAHADRQFSLVAAPASIRAKPDEASSRHAAPRRMDHVRSRASPIGRRSSSVATSQPPTPRPLPSRISEACASQCGQRDGAQPSRAHLVRAASSQD